MSTQWSEKFRQAAEAILPSPKRPSTPIENVTLKQLTKGSGFGRSVHCTPGQVTVIQDAAIPRETTFRDALLGKHQTPAMLVRSGIDEVRRSEMYVVGSNDFGWEGKTVLEALRQAGAPEQEIETLLEQAGLSEHAVSTPKSLQPSDLKRLSILQSLFARARLVVYDKPFSGLDQTSTQALAKLMVEAAMHHQRVMLVLGEIDLPSAWKNHDGVKVAVPVKRVSKTGIPIPVAVEPTPIEEMVRNLSASGLQTKPMVTMGRAAAQETAAEDIVTRPQMIFDVVRGKHVETVRSEVINNPHVSQDLQPPQRSRAAGRPPSNPGFRLTGMSWKRRMKVWASEMFESLTAVPPEEETRSTDNAVSRLAISILIGVTVVLLVTGIISVIMDLSMK